jgi:hypothetical protein
LLKIGKQVKLALMSNPAFQHAKTLGRRSGGSRARERAQEKIFVENFV